ncbi:mechanosensitive ion channel family protein [uncultured Bdellovibrio sp.]|uniref:mechanosensitive ion channel family protein n=1 Tax=Bdellovibrio sp. HCB-162 TaxID=3394234 RepID=UPI0025CEFCD0|nr:mechanosensitive ion channel family protein [uncultured Bdellovibrio sp.]
MKYDIVHFDPLIARGSVWEWVVVFVLAIIFSAGLKYTLKFVVNRWKKIAKNTHWKVDDFIISCLDNTRSWVLFVAAFYLLSGFVDARPEIKKALYVVFVAVSTIQVGIWGIYALRTWQKNYLTKKMSTDASSASAINIIVTAMNVFFVVALVMIALSNIGVNIGAMLAGMGIGGIAIALAAQNILGDLFGSLSIILDKPFVVGDYIVVGNDEGTVENIGVKTTRVRSLTGEELIFANKDLLESRVKNFKRMWKRRVSLKFSVPLETSSEKLKQIPDWVKEYVVAISLLQFERCHFSGIGESFLKFETVFWVNDPSFAKYMDLQQELLLKLIDRFRAENVQLAIPTSAFEIKYLDKNEERREPPPFHQEISH